ncbi:hypothetical protein HYR99_18715 [Candidatus Poribacteria bacterium]|nr:hypothetical protein [Candidatus Poribacteria bacterium]
MTRFKFIFIGVFILGVLLIRFGYLYYHNRPTQKQQRNTDQTIARLATSNLPSKFPYANAITILYTGNTQGYLEPCGCYLGQSGGVVRRATLIERIRQENPPGLLVLDAGEIFDGYTLLDRLRVQTYLKAMELTQYDALAVSAKEFGFGETFLEQQASQIKISFLLTNATKGAESSLVPYLIKEVEGKRILIFGLSSHWEADETDNVTFVDPVVAVEQLLSQMKDRVDLIVILSNLEKEENRMLARYIHRIDLIISNRESAQEGQAERVDKTLIVYSATKGITLGKLDLTLDQEGKILHYHPDMIPMDETVPDHAPTRQLLEKFYTSVATDTTLQGATKKLFANETLELDKSNGYVGAEACTKCHASEYQQWKTTYHAAAYNTLLKLQKHFYPDCVTCHVTGFGYQTGFATTKLSQDLANIQCETCHGPGLHHLLDPRKETIRGKVEEKICLECHNQEHAPGFNERYKDVISKVDHSKEALDVITMLENRIKFRRDAYQTEIELHMMSQCPFSNKLLKDLIPLVKRYKNQIALKIHYITAENIGWLLNKQSRFRSLHGQQEVAENIRQLVIAKLYPDKVLDYLLCRTENYSVADQWRECANQVGIDIAQVRMLVEEEGEQLLSQNTKRSAELQISQSPLLFIDGTRFHSASLGFSFCDSEPESRYPDDFTILEMTILDVLPPRELKLLTGGEVAQLNDIREALRGRQNEAIFDFTTVINSLKQMIEHHPSNAYIRMLLAEAYRLQGNAKLARKIYSETGAILNDQWLLLGPFENDFRRSQFVSLIMGSTMKGFNKVFPPEQGVDLAASYGVTYTSSGKISRRWTPPNYKIIQAFVNIPNQHRANPATSYAVVYVHSPKAVTGQIRLGLKGAGIKLWVNKSMVYSDGKRDHTLRVDDFIIPIELHKRENEILVKLVYYDPSAGFLIRLTDESGLPLEGVAVVPKMNEPPNQEEKERN